jgi:hypothetical protein
MFSLDQFVADCRAALEEDASQAAVREVVARCLRSRGGVKGRG